MSRLKNGCGEPVSFSDSPRAASEVPALILLAVLLILLLIFLVLLVFLILLVLLVLLGLLVLLVLLILLILLLVTVLHKQSSFLLYLRDSPHGISVSPRG